MLGSKTVLLAFDLDKTIVTADYTLPSAIADAIHRARDKGHQVSVLTGRPLAATTDFLEQLGVDAYYSVNHGSYVVGLEGAVLRQAALSEAETAAILKPYLNHPDIEFSSVLGDTLYVRDPSHERWHWAHTDNRNVAVFDADAGRNADKLVFLAAGRGPEIAEHVRSLYPELILYPWEEDYLEVTAAKSDKGSALNLIAAELNIPQSEVVAFGDGPNDITMLDWAAHAVAVGDGAYEDLLALADEHIAGPEDLGVKDWLEENIL